MTTTILITAAVILVLASPAGRAALVNTVVDVLVYVVLLG